MALFHHDHDPDADPASLVYTFGGAAPVASLAPGTVLATWTRDCFAGRVTRADHRSTELVDPRYLNPQTGPFFVEGAEPGDTLALHFVSIEPRETWGVSTTVPFFGALTSTLLNPTLQPALPEMTWIYGIDTVERLVRYEARESDFTVDLPLDPMHGTVGVAPALGEVRNSLVPGDWGGNMDTPELRAGTTVYLGVNVPGALFSLGDGHARQGEGESCGVAVETAMDTVLVVDLIKATPCPWPRLESDTHLITTGSTRPLDDALRIAHAEMVRWLGEETGLSPMDAYQLVSQAVQTPVANMVDTAYTVTAKLPKSLLGARTPMGGVHERLKAIAAAELGASGPGSGSRR